MHPTPLNDIPSPALLFDPAVIERNLEAMIRLAGSPDRLRPHVKTHKCPNLIERQLARGIRKFKCATIAEAEMAARCGGESVLLAKQPVGPDIERLARLRAAYPETEFLGLVDHPDALKSLGAAFSRRSLSIGLLVDIDCGMGRTGIAPGTEAAELYRAIAAEPFLAAAGLHAYDGHIRDSLPEERRAACEKAFAPVLELKTQLEAEGLSVPSLVAGGSPTFPFHAANAAVTDCSPGTTVLWDDGYRQSFPELPFEPAAFLLARVISRPGDSDLCLDLGYKAISADAAQPRVAFDTLPDVDFVSHHEEHLVIRCLRKRNFLPGDSLIGIPKHVCPTVALFDQAWILGDEATAVDRWPISARTRNLGI